ncbi:imidazole glycerol phosphate synthase subunit HisH [Pontibacillus litoralis]|uniref:Imidazole glycerol phosphate synthase subunit HisH n=1 Tax=Pontibacillus litoralis JSM 072002 TaxID=1385512 RepID=A0A0A5HRE6_9BACI|nr:imidazole glycerol phosphate synthase subunit HisH [Pontibacillus litoralis]KGX86207.1 imidazole glycerol phosphate synthase [Pontibacillus litoralis JSM 072002]
MIGIIDYGMGNLFSVSKALQHMDIPHVVSASPSELQTCKGLLLPGVGAFPDAMKSLEASGMKDFLLHQVNQGVPLLGICLGMQLLFEESAEGKGAAGLALLPGRVVRFTGQDVLGNRYKVPHMGWNDLTFYQRNDVLTQSITGGYVYFVHSYYVETMDPSIVIASARYETEVPAIVGKGNVYGTQFHPEKSATTGMAILGNFCNFIMKKEECLYGTIHNLSSY